jgi:hypothetical protein
MHTNARAFTVFLALSVPAVAAAQDSDVDLVPTRREFLDPALEFPHDPFNLGARRTAYTVGLKLAGVFDDNVFLSESDEEEDFITVVLLSADVVHRVDENEARFSYRGRERIYADHGDLTGMEHYLDGSGVMRVSRFILGAGLEYRDRKDSFNPLEIPEPVDSRYLAVAIRGGAVFNEFDLLGSLEVAQFSIDDDFHDRGDYDRIGFSLRASAKTWPQAESFGEIVARSTDYEEDAFSDFSYYRLAVGARGTFSPTLRGEASIGYARTEEDEAGDFETDDFSGLVLEAVGTWALNEKNEFAAGLTYGPSESAVTGLTVRQGVHAGWLYRMTERLGFRSSVRWSRESDPEGDLDRSGLQVRGSARWESGDHFYADAGVLLRAADSDDPTLEYDNVRISFGLGVEW